MLEEPQVFIVTATLIVIVLLVWTQLSASGRRTNADIDLNLAFNVAWNYSAIIFTLLAVILVFLFTGPWAKRFLVLSFLMTGTSVFIWLSVVVYKLYYFVFSKNTENELSFNKSLTGLSKDSPREEKRSWFYFWVFLLVGLGFVSFSIEFTYSWISLGIGAVIIVINAFCGWRIIQRTRKEQRVKGSDLEKEAGKKLLIAIVGAYDLIKFLRKLFKNND